MNEPWTDAEREQQLVRAAAMSSSTCCTNRGTGFGLMTGGNVEAILMSLPTVASWR